MSMKMARASEADLKAAMELCALLDGLDRGHFPSTDDDEDYPPFDVDREAHCKAAMDAILAALQRGSLSRVVYGMAVVLDPRNEVVDPECPHLELHPKHRRPAHTAALDALRAVMATATVQAALGRLANGQGTATDDGKALLSAQALLKTVEQPVAPGAAGGGR